MTFRIGRRGFIGSALAAAALHPFRTLAAALGYPRLLEGPVVGPATADSITLWGRPNGDFHVDVEYSTSTSKSPFGRPQSVIESAVAGPTTGPSSNRG